MEIDAVRADVQKRLGDLRSWDSASTEAKEAFTKELIGKSYGYDALFNAWTWFLKGWNARAD